MAVIVRLRPATPAERIERLLQAVLSIANGHDGIPCCGVEPDDADQLAGLAEERTGGRCP